MKVLMVQGTTSDAGKSTLVAGLCRVLSDQKIKVAPFKPQNMALNSAITEDGGEIGRAQALQAVAARVPAQIDFNPILLKPNSDTGAQVIVHGKAVSSMEAEHYHDYKKVAMQAVLTSHQRLAQQFDVLLVEGAGSPAEINLRENDIANMGYAEEVDCPVIIIADIDKGGVFAHLVGTLALLSRSEQARVCGFVINRFRGERALLQSGIEWLEQKTRKPVLGVLPYIHDLALDAEDDIAIDNVTDNTQMTIAVLLLPHISNHTDFDTLRLHPNIDLQYIRVGQPICPCDLVIIPGSKNVISDLSFLRTQDWHKQIQRHLRYGGKVLGICGGLQMLGNRIADPEHIESTTDAVTALQLADFDTVLHPNKQLKQVTGSLLFDQQQTPFSGYEIHCGVSTGSAMTLPFLTIEENQQQQADGLISEDNQVAGTYVHGLFDSPQATVAILRWISASNAPTHAVDLAAHREKQLDALANTYRQHLDIHKIHDILAIGE